MINWLLPSIEPLHRRNNISSRYHAAAAAVVIWKIAHHLCLRD